MAKPRRPQARQEGQKVRCAIYTRKSTEDGLEQEFNSLDAQREACAAYILSQRHEGWVQLPELYDDGGYSGGTMERPGLKQLLTDVEAGKVDVIVLYKVDRLTRSLADFARIVEVLDGAGASFVSITQSFNTTTSMGRLTLNVLLSFAQFEREVTGERIRDKIAQSKAKGMWMGGVVPLGYDVSERKLVINEVEAATVRMIFERYAALGSTGLLTDELRATGVVTKQRVFSDGRRFGGIPFEHGSLAHLLKNCAYVGEVRHREKVHPGEHPPIIERDLWDKVQALLAGNTRERRTTSRATEQSLLTGMISDGRGRPMTPTHSTRGTRRYRYYVSRHKGGDDAHRVWRLPARAIEQLVLRRMAQAIGKGEALAERLPETSAETLELIRRRGGELGTGLSNSSAFEASEVLRELELRVQLHDDRLELRLNPKVLLDLALGGDRRWVEVELQDATDMVLNVPMKMQRRGQELKLVSRQADPTAPAEVDTKLVELIIKAYRACERLERDGASLPRSEVPNLTRHSRLAYLAPDIIQAIVDGKRVGNVSPRSLLRSANLPVCWQAQRELLGFV
ncbi:MAG TPA: recombinase family protein [Allosphingosinicella sp.]|jgi:DNA invertase Pin-like site-specific DNA recombinase